MLAYGQAEAHAREGRAGRKAVGKEPWYGPAAVKGEGYKMALGRQNVETLVAGGGVGRLGKGTARTGGRQA